MITVDDVPVSPRARVYAEGWQSWSPASWYPGHERSARPELEWQHLMRFRPGTAIAAEGVQAEGLLVVDPGDDRPARAYGPVSAAGDVPTLLARLERDRIVVTATAAVHSWEVDAAGGDAGAAALDAFGEQFGRAAGARAATTPPPRVWCTWYQYFEEVTAADVRENLAAMAARDLPVDVVQIDDGWSLGTGAWTRPNPRFGDLADTVARIRDSGRRAGVWLAPFCVGAGSDVAQEHPEWLTGPAGYNWGDDLVGLDLTHPGVRQYLGDTVSRLRDLGVDYLKLDFLYAGAVPGDRHDPQASPVAAYRSGLAVIREAIGEEAYLLGCGAPLLPSVGMVDAMRISPDTFHEGGEDGSQGLRGRPSLEARAWQHGRLWTTDPDCMVARPEFALREEWARVVLAAPGVRGFSDRIGALDARGEELVRLLLEGERS